MDASMIAHEWAHGRDKKYARVNVFAESGTIYSYGRHFPMARFYQSEAGRVVLFTSHGYSVSTARHLSYVRQAVRGQTVFTVDKVCGYAGGDLSKAEHKENHRKMLEDCARLVAKSKAPRIRPATVSDLLSQAEALRKSANEYRAAFKLGGRDVESVGVAAERIVKAERAAALKAKREAARRKTEAAERFAKWCAGAEDVRASGFSEWPVSFRLKPGTKGRVVESSLGAEFTAASARGAWPRIKAIWSGLTPAAQVDNYAPTDIYFPVAGNRADDVLTISGFRVTSVHRDNGIVIGCHNVSWEAAEALARLLGV